MEARFRSRMACSWARISLSACPGARGARVPGPSRAAWPRAPRAARSPPRPPGSARRSPAVRRPGPEAACGERPLPRTDRYCEITWTGPATRWVSSTPKRPRTTAMKTARPAQEAHEPRLRGGQARRKLAGSPAPSAQERSEGSLGPRVVGKEQPREERREEGPPARKPGPGAQREGSGPPGTFDAEPFGKGTCP